MGGAQGALDTGGESALIDYLTAQSDAFGKKAHSTFTDLFHNLVVKFHDGYIAEKLDQEKIDMVSIFYPKWWLEQVKYFRNAAYFAKALNRTLPEEYVPFVNWDSPANNFAVSSGVTSTSHFSSILGFVATAVIFTLVGMYVSAKRYARLGYQKL